jgi:hypothetical protein
MFNHEPTQKEMDDIGKYFANLKPPMTTDEARKLEMEQFRLREEQRRKYDEEQTLARRVEDPVTKELVQPEVLRERTNARVAAEIKERYEHPVPLTDAEMRAAIERNADIRARYDAARNESLKRQGLTDVAIGKY